MNWFQVLLLCLAILMLVFLGSKARAHDWYPRVCCSDFDCRPINENLIHVGPDGYTYTVTGQTLAYNDRRIQFTPPEGGQEYHICTVGGREDSRVLCLFVPHTTG